MLRGVDFVKHQEDDKGWDLRSCSGYGPEGLDACDYMVGGNKPILPLCCATCAPAKSDGGRDGGDDEDFEPTMGQKFFIGALAVASFLLFAVVLIHALAQVTRAARRGGALLQAKPVRLDMESRTQRAQVQPTPLVPPQTMISGVHMTPKRARAHPVMHGLAVSTTESDTVTV